ncbi:MAG: hypothetical protein WC790_03880 [Candidatus Paceibacterota bacterium]|jgi:hypothetical protein
MNAFTLFATIETLGVLLLLATMFCYFALAGRGFISRFKNEDCDAEPFTLLLGLVYTLTAVFWAGISYAVDKTIENGQDMVGTALLLSLSLTIPIVIAGAKSSTRFFHQDVRFANWWSMKVVSIGPKRTTVLWSL